MSSNKINLPYVTLVIPCFNESKRLHFLENSLLEFHEQWQYGLEVVVVDDGSKDDTSVLAQQILDAHFEGQFPYQVLRLDTNQGKGGALRAGVLAANGKFILTLDADMAAHPNELLNWMQYFPDQQFPSNSILIASRNHPKSNISAKSYRKVTGTIYNSLVKSVTPIQHSDTQCGFKLYPAPLGKLLFENLLIKGWAHDIELLYKAHYLGIAVQSMPVAWRHIEGEKISVLKDGIQMAVKTINLSWKFRFSTEMKIELRALQRKKMRLDLGQN